MHIKITCPQCDGAYQVDSDLRGKRMRCPNPICQAVFEVRDPGEPDVPSTPAIPTPPPTPPVMPSPTQSGNVGDVVPILSAETATRSERPQSAAPPVSTPPSQRSQSGESVPAHFSPRAKKHDGSLFDDIVPVSVESEGVPFWGDTAAAFSHDAPPVRQSAGGATAAPKNNGAPNISSSAFEMPAMENGRSGWRRITASVIVLAIVAIGIAVWMGHGPAPSDEAERFARAEKDYQEGSFADASQQFRALQRDFHDSKYQFLSELSDIRESIQRIHTDEHETTGVLERLKKFLEIYEPDPMMQNHREEISQSIYRLVEELTRFAHNLKKRALLENAVGLNAYAHKQFKPPPPAQATSILVGLETAEVEVAKGETRKRVLDHLSETQDSPTLAGIEEAKALVHKADLTGDAEIKAALDSLPHLHVKSVTFREDWAGPSKEPSVGDAGQNIAIVLNRGPSAESASAGTRPAFALSRGVLYAFEPGNGKLRWVCRVGVDTVHLPLWLPATPQTPPTVLIASPEAGGLLAINGDDGTFRWRQIVPEACLGTPLLVGDRVLVTSRTGAIFEINVADGQCRGGYDLGEELTFSGVWHPGTNNVYFAANQGCIFVLDVVQRQCTDILYTGHASGALRCPPVVLPLSRGDVADPSKAGPAPAQLLLSLDDGRQKTELHAYSLPLVGEAPAPLSSGPIDQPLHQPLIKLSGRTWMPPHYTSESFGLVTDSGALSVFGIRQRVNRDDALFPQSREPLQIQGGVKAGDKPLVVHADSQNWWVLANGRLHLFQSGLSPKFGWRIVFRPLRLPLFGSALHAAKVIDDGHGNPVLILVTEAPEGRATMITAVDLDERTIRWQRQIGFVPQKALVTADKRVMGWDQSGDLVAFEPKMSIQLPGEWQLGGKGTIADLPGPAWLLPKSDGQFVLALITHGPLARIWKVQGETIAEAGPAKSLDGLVSGTPALLGDKVVLPLDNGKLAVLGPGAAFNSDQWRSAKADKNARGHAAAASQTRLICTDGSKGITLWRVDGNSIVRMNTTEVGSRIIAVAALSTAIVAAQPGAKTPEPGSFRICVADVDRHVSLFEGDGLKKVRDWVVNEPITAGPFVRGGFVVVVVANRRLVLIDPDQQDTWGMTFPNDIVGEPQLVDGKLIVADEGGRIQALDPNKKQVVGLSYTLHADVAPAAAPLAFADDRLFVPLTDGTVLLLSRSWFRPTILGIPVKR